MSARYVRGLAADPRGMTIVDTQTGDGQVAVVVSYGYGAVVEKVLDALNGTTPIPAGYVDTKAHGKKCPECGGTDVEWDNPADPNSSDATCCNPECGYESRWFPDEDGNSELAEALDAIAAAGAAHEASKTS